MLLLFICSVFVSHGVRHQQQPLHHIQHGAEQRRGHVLSDPSTLYRPSPRRDRVVPVPALEVRERDMMAVVPPVVAASRGTCSRCPSNTRTLCPPLLR